MAKIQINVFVDVEVKTKDGHSWEALHEGYEIVKKVLQRNKNIGDAFYEGISRVYW